MHFFVVNGLLLPSGVFSSHCVWTVFGKLLLTSSLPEATADCISDLLVKTDSNTCCLLLTASTVLCCNAHSLILVACYYRSLKSFLQRAGGNTHISPGAWQHIKLPNDNGEKAVTPESACKSYSISLQSWLPHSADELWSGSTAVTSGQRAHALSGLMQLNQTVHVMCTGRQLNQGSGYVAAHAGQNQKPDFVSSEIVQIPLSSVMLLHRKPHQGFQVSLHASIQQYLYLKRNSNQFYNNWRVQKNRISGLPCSGTEARPAATSINYWNCFLFIAHHTWVFLLQLEFFCVLAIKLLLETGYWKEKRNCTRQALGCVPQPGCTDGEFWFDLHNKQKAEVSIKEIRSLTFMNRVGVQGYSLHLG